MLQTLITALLTIVTSAITAYFASKLSVRAERRRWEDERALELSKMRADNPAIAARLAQDSAIAFLVLSEPGRERQKFFIPARGRLLVGRGVDLDIPLETSVASHQHMQFVSDGGVVWVHELAGTFGVLLNGDRMDGRSKLKDGDQISVGDASLVFHSL